MQYFVIFSLNMRTLKKTQIKTAKFETKTKKLELCY